MDSVLLMSVAVVATLVVMVPRHWRRRVFGYVNAFDCLGLAITLRGGRALMGSEKLAVNGDSSLRTVFIAVTGQGLAWTRAIVRAAFNGGTVVAPEPLAWSWIEDRSAHTPGEAITSLMAEI
jgi:Na+-transporting NADH:ubiquinone oxidoreductase subunit NqrE